MSSPADPADREQGTAFLPRYDANGLIAAMAIDATTSAPLMLAWMNAQALALTQSTGFAHFWSRSRQSLWKKGEASGHVLEVVDILVDCDQDALVLRCRPAGPACHTGARSCFYRKLDDGALIRADT